MAGVSVGIDRRTVHVELGRTQQIELALAPRSSASGTLSYLTADGRISRTGRVRFESEAIRLDLPTDGSGAYNTGRVPAGAYEVSFFDLNGTLLDRRTVVLEPFESAEVSYRR